jgi:hypothetical protein
MEADIRLAIFVVVFADEMSCGAVKAVSCPSVAFFSRYACRWRLSDLIPVVSLWWTRREVWIKDNQVKKGQVENQDESEGIKVKTPVPIRVDPRVVLFGKHLLLMTAGPQPLQQEGRNAETGGSSVRASLQLESQAT